MLGTGHMLVNKIDVVLPVMETVARWRRRMINTQGQYKCCICSCLRGPLHGFIFFFFLIFGCAGS